ncbi:hypothetical protein ACVIHH_000251 [Bradyrhizobium sp. USDA 4518]
MTAVLAAASISCSGANSAADVVPEVNGSGASSFLTAQSDIWPLACISRINSTGFWTDRSAFRLSLKSRILCAANRVLLLGHRTNLTPVEVDPLGAGDRHCIVVAYMTLVPRNGGSGHFRRNCEVIIPRDVRCDARFQRPPLLGSSKKHFG